MGRTVASMHVCVYACKCVRVCMYEICTHACMCTKSYLDKHKFIQCAQSSSHCNTRALSVHQMEARQTPEHSVRSEWYTETPEHSVCANWYPYRHKSFSVHQTVFIATPKRPFEFCRRITPGDPLLSPPSHSPAFLLCVCVFLHVAVYGQPAHVAMPNYMSRHGYVCLASSMYTGPRNGPRPPLPPPRLIQDQRTKLIKHIITSDAICFIWYPGQLVLMFHQQACKRAAQWW